MEFSRLFLVFAVCICELIHKGSSIRCIDCSSINNTMCLDPTIYDQETVNLYLGSVDCSNGVYSRDPKEFFCRKIVQAVLHKNHDSEIRVLRGCGWVKDGRQRACYKADNEDHQETVCQCFSDNCNGAEKIEVSLAWVVIGVMARSLIN